MKQSKTEKQSILIKSKILTDRKKTTISQYANVNSYKHFLAIPSANQSYIQWAFGLRSGDQVKSTSTITAAPPEAYYKTIQSQKMKHTSAELNQNTNISQFEHMALHRVGMPASSGQLKFQTTLRINKDKSLYEKQRKWCTIPKVQRNEIPKIIKSRSLKKKFIQPQQMQTALDGLQNYPKFTQKIIKMRNINQFRHMIKGKVNLPSISWQANLRSY